MWLPAGCGASRDVRLLRWTALDWRLPAPLTALYRCSRCNWDRPLSSTRGINAAGRRRIVPLPTSSGLTSVTAIIVVFAIIVVVICYIFRAVDFVFFSFLLPPLQPNDWSADLCCSELGSSGFESTPPLIPRFSFDPFYLFIYLYLFFFLLSKIQLWLNHQWATTELRLMIGIDNSVDCSGTPTPQRGRWIRMAVLGGAISVPSNEQRPSPYWCDDGGWQNGRFLMLLPRRWCWIAIDSGGSVSLFEGETKTFYVSGTARYQNFNLIIIERLKFESLRILTDSGFHPCRREGPFPSNSTDSFFEF